MATIKSYTTIEQSRKLAEILPLESADMLWEQHGTEPYVTVKPWTTRGKSIGCHCLSCWSLAALLEVLPYCPDLSKHTDGKWYITTYPNDVHTCLMAYDNPVDACVAMIERLHELKLL